MENMLVKNITDIKTLNFEIDDVRDIINVGNELIKFANDESRKPTINIETGEIFSYNNRLITTCRRI